MKHAAAECIKARTPPTKVSSLKLCIWVVMRALSLKLGSHLSLMASMLQTQHEPSETPTRLLLAMLSFLSQ